MKIGEVPSNPVSAWVGLVQRVALFTYFAWIFTFALEQARRSLEPLH